jgi:hypothetical protein
VPDGSVEKQRGVGAKLSEVEVVVVLAGGVLFTWRRSRGGGGDESGAWVGDPCRGPVP